MTVCDKFNLPNLDPRVVQKQHNTFDFVQYEMLRMFGLANTCLGVMGG